MTFASHFGDLDFVAILKGSVAAVLVGLAFGVAAGLVAEIRHFTLLFIPDASPEATFGPFIAKAPDAVVFVTQWITYVVAGYVAARTAGRKKIDHSVATGVVCILYNFLRFTMMDNPPVGLSAGVYLITVVALAAAGGWIASRRRQDER